MDDERFELAVTEGTGQESDASSAKSVDGDGTDRGPDARGAADVPSRADELAQLGDEIVRLEGQIRADTRRYRELVEELERRGGRGGGG